MYFNFKSATYVGDFRIQYSGTFWSSIEWIFYFKIIQKFIEETNY